MGNNTMSVRTVIRQWQSGSGIHLQKRQVATLLLVVLVSLTVIGLVSIYTLVRPSYMNSVDTTSVTVSVYDTATAKKTPVKRLFGLLLVPRSAEALAFETDAQESLLLAPKQLGTFGIANVEVSFQEPIAAKLINVGSDDCPIISAGKIFSYQCNFPVGFSLYKANAPGLDKQEEKFRFSAKYTSGQYQDGILAWSSQGNTRTTSEAELIQYIVPEKGIVATIELPKETIRTDYLQIITDRGNPQNTAFVAYDYSAGVGYYYPNVTDKVAPKVVKRKRQFNIDANNSSCVLSSTIFSCYHGRPGGETHEYDEPGFINEGRPGGAIERTDMGAESLDTRTYNNGSSEIDELYATASGTLYARGRTTLSRVDLRAAGFGTTTISSNSTIADAGNSLHYVQNGKVYTYDESSDVANMVYRDDRQEIYKLSAHGNRVFSLNQNKRDPLQLLNVYDITTGDTQ